MLQFITAESNRYSVEEQVNMAIEGGCRWIQLTQQVAGDREPGLRHIAQSIMPQCRECDAFLVIEDDVDLVEELKVHGVVLRDSSRATVAAARERLGAHAVIGVEVSSADEILALKGLDVDYVMIALTGSGDADNPLDVATKYAELFSRLNAAGIDFHLVARGEFPVPVLPAILEAGCAGVAMSTAITEAEHPAAATARIVDVLDRARFGNGLADESDADADSVNV